MKHDPELARLLLLKLRDGGYENQVNQYPEELVLQQKARLIDEGLATGKAIKDGLHLRWVKGLQISTAGHHWLESHEASEFKPSKTPQVSEPMSAPTTSKLIFVSHSSVDKDLAEALLDMLCTALHLRLADFLCTTVDGAKLRGGDQTDDVLRREIRDVPAFLSILTQQAISSTYVLFELGARWGCEKHHIPLLAKGSNASALKEPLKATNALQLSNESDVLQLVENLAAVLGRTAEPPNSFLKKARKVVELSLVRAGTSDSLVQSPSNKEKNRVNSILANAIRGPGRIDEEAESILKELASKGNLVMNPLEDPKSMGMHRVRLERCIMILEQENLLQDGGTIANHLMLRITQAGKKYLLDHDLV